MQRTFNAPAITREAAEALVAATRTAARDIGIRASIAVADAGGHLVAFARDDGAPFLTANVAIDKAWTSASFGLPTHVWADVIANPQVASLAHQPRLVAVGGGVPIVVDGRVVGGVGVSGGNAQQDRDAAEVALKALGFEVAA